MPTSAAVQIIPFRDDLAADFDRINRAWLVAGDFLEATDELYLSAPRARIVDAGGEIFFAIDGETVLGTAAAIPLGERRFELAKVAVTPSAKGRGLGRQLVLRALRFAWERGATHVVLTSNTRLVTAVALYRSLGFVERPCPDGFGYQTADLYMELTRDPAATR